MMAWGAARPATARRAPPRRLTASQRMAICRKCPSMTRDKRCVHCGCFLKLKTRVPTEKCPTGKW